MIDIVQATDAAPPGGHYAHAVRAQGFVFVSGILPVQPDGTILTAEFDAQIGAVLSNFDAVLRAARCARSDVAKVTVYVTDIDTWPTFDAAYAAFFGDHRPARAVVPVPTLHHGCGLELEATAVEAGP